MIAKAENQPSFENFLFQAPEVVALSGTGFSTKKSID